MNRQIIALLISILMLSCQPTGKNVSPTADKREKTIVFNADIAQMIMKLPLHCLTVEYPNKLGQTIGSAADLKTPSQLHSIFYGCFDWHSSVHGYWSLVKLMKKFPNLPESGAAKSLLVSTITPENVKKEMSFFLDPNNKGFERTYGWAWLLQLQAELLTWEDSAAHTMATALQPLADLLVERYEDYLPKLVYPIRSGQHDNSAFGFSLSLDYARVIKDKKFENLLIEHAQRLYKMDKSCPLQYEPSGSDFLSPCLEEANLMTKILQEEDYRNWLKEFMPDLFHEDFNLAPGIVKDRTDGKLVHLDGLNFSRSTCLNAIADKLPELHYLTHTANQHLEYSLKNISNDDYMGSHWLGTFALYAITHQ